MKSRYRELISPSLLIRATKCLGVAERTSVCGHPVADFGPAPQAGSRAACDARKTGLMGSRPVSGVGLFRWLPALKTRAVHSFVKGRQLCAIIGDEDGEQACRLRSTPVLADEVFAAGRLEKA